MISARTSASSQPILTVHAFQWFVSARLIAGRLRCALPLSEGPLSELAPLPTPPASRRTASDMPPPLGGDLRSWRDPRHCATTPDAPRGSSPQDQDGRRR